MYVDVSHRVDLYKYLVPYSVLYFRHNFLKNVTYLFLNYDHETIDKIKLWNTLYTYVVLVAKPIPNRLDTYY